jgi:DNA-binding response OmpR family regulator
MRVLVLSADPAERRRASSALPAGEFDVVEHDAPGPARAAVEAARGAGAPFDVLVVDGDLAPRGGYALLYELRAADEVAGRAPTPSIAMGSRAADRWLAGWAGASALHLKPVDPFDLADEVRAVAARPVSPYGDAGSAAAQVGTALRRTGR